MLKVILILKEQDEREWIHLAPYRGQWQAFVNWAMHFPVLPSTTNFLNQISNY